MTVCYKLNNIEVVDCTEHAFDRLQSMKKAERKEAIKKANRKRKERIESIKLTFTLIFFCGVLPLLAFMSWIQFGY